jgi:hypothetical protein
MGAFVAVVCACLAMAGTVFASSLPIPPIIPRPDLPPADGSTNYVTLTFTGDSLARLGWVVYGGRLMITQVGQSNFTVGQDAQGKGLDIVGASVDGQTTGYCIDIRQSIQINQQVAFTVMDLIDAPTLADPSRAADLEKLFSLHSGEVADAQSAAAFAACVWEIVNERGTDFDLRTGTFMMAPVIRSDGWVDTADGWLDGLNNPDAGVGDVTAYALVSARVQDFAWIMAGNSVGDPPPGDPPNVIPEPITMLSSFLAVSAVGFYARRRRAKVAA